MTALRIASANPHAVVAFVHLACSGAEVVDGLLAPQRFPPGHSMNRCKPPRKRSDPNEWDKECDVPYSQLNAAVDLLCPEASRPLSADKLKEIKAALKNIAHNKAQVNWLDANRRDSLRSCQTELRKIEYVFISIGGNDVGFSGLIADALLPRSTHIRTPLVDRLASRIVEIVQNEGNIVCPYLPSGATPEDLKRQKQCKEYGLPANTRILDIPERYAGLKVALEHVLQLNSKTSLTADKIILNLYPNPLYKEAGARCGNPGNHKEDNEWAAIHTVLPPSKGILRITQVYDWEVNFTESEARDVERHVIDPLNLKIKEMGDKFRWQVVPTQDVMKEQGWCTGDLRKFSRINPSKWNPYISHQRLIRTANDSLLTQWPRKQNETESGDQSYIERENGFYGMFHPNAHGHAAIAERVIAHIQGSSMLP